GMSCLDDATLPMSHDKTVGASCFFRVQRHCSIGGFRGIESAAQTIESAVRHQDANDRLTVAGARNSAVVIGISAAAQEGRVPYSARDFVKDPARGSRNSNLAPGI